MIEFLGVDYKVKTSKGMRSVLDEMTGAIPQGHYALLTGEPAVRIGLVDLICGVRAPHAGKILRQGRVSWPIGRLTHFRSALDGHQTIEFVSDLYDLDRRCVLDFVRGFCDMDQILNHKLLTWPGHLSLKLSLALALLPRFDIFVVDGSMLTPDKDFQARWNEAFAEKTREKTIIIATSQLNAIKSFCDLAIIADYGCLFTTQDVHAAIALYPLRPADDFRAVNFADESGEGDELDSDF